MTKNIPPEEVEAFLRQVKLVGVAVTAVVLIPLCIYAFYLNRRLDSFESSLRHSPPQELDSDAVVRGDLYHLTTNPVEGQIVYVPAYSHVYHGKGDPNLLTITLSVRNTSMDRPIVVESIRYFDTKGQEVKAYLDKPVRLAALAATEVVIERDNASGGSGANFLVKWHADQPVTEPIIEAVMIDTNSQQGISFVCRGSVISEVVPDSPNVKSGLSQGIDDRHSGGLNGGSDSSDDPDQQRDNRPRHQQTE